MTEEECKRAEFRERFRKSLAAAIEEVERERRRVAAERMRREIRVIEGGRT